MAVKCGFVIKFCDRRGEDGFSSSDEGLMSEGSDTIANLPLAIVMNWKIQSWRLLAAMRHAQKTAITSPSETVPSLTSFVPKRIFWTNMAMLTSWLIPLVMPHTPLALNVTLLMPLRLDQGPSVRTIAHWKLWLLRWCCRHAPWTLQRRWYACAQQRQEGLQNVARAFVRTRSLAPRSVLQEKVPMNEQRQGRDMQWKPLDIVQAFRKQEMMRLGHHPYPQRKVVRNPRKSNLAIGSPIKFGHQATGTDKPFSVGSNKRILSSRFCIKPLHIQRAHRGINPWRQPHYVPLSRPVDIHNASVTLLSAMAPTETARSSKVDGPTPWRSACRCSSAHLALGSPRRNWRRSRRRLS